MGNKSVSATQYDEAQMELGARAKVMIEDDAFFYKSCTAFSDSAKPSQAVHRRKTSPDDEKSSGDDGEDSVEKSLSDLRISPRVQKAPIKWFGILVPQCLKDCQAKFKKAGELSCKVSSLRIKYCELQKQYRELKMVKKQILEDSVELSDLSAAAEY